MISPPSLRRRQLTGAVLAAGLLFVALALFGERWHWVEEAGSAERDGYVAQAEAILEGELPRDPFRPALYPLAVAGLARLGPSPFAAARLISNAAAAALALLALLLAARLAGPVAGWAAFAATAVNPNLWILGQHTTTDMPFAALAAAAVLAGLLYLDRPSRGSALAAGAALGLASFVRANGLFLAPALLLAWWLAPAGPGPPATGRSGLARWRPGGRPAHLALAALAAALCLLPHFVLRAAVFGHPLHDENWKNLAFKLHGFPDWSYLERVPFTGLWDVVAADPGAVVGGGLSELARFATGGLAQLLGTPLHALLLLVGAALVLAVPRRRIAAAWLLVAAGTVLAGVAATFFTWGRLLLVLLPVGNALAFAPWGQEVRDAWARRLAGRGEASSRRRDGGVGGDAEREEGAPGAVGHRVRIFLRSALIGHGGDGSRPGSPAMRLARSAPALLLALLVGLLAAKTFLFRLPAFAEHHPYAEVAALRELAAETPPGTVLAGTTPFLGRYLDRPYLYVPDAFGTEVEEPALYLRKLRAILAGGDARYLVTGPLDLRSRPESLLGEASPVPWLRRVGGEGEVAVWRVVDGGAERGAGAGSGARRPVRRHPAP